MHSDRWFTILGFEIWFWVFVLPYLIYILFGPWVAGALIVWWLLGYIRVMIQEWWARRQLLKYFEEEERLSQELKYEEDQAFTRDFHKWLDDGDDLELSK